MTTPVNKSTLTSTYDRSMAKNFASFIDMFKTSPCLSDILIISEIWLIETDSDMFKINICSQIFVPRFGKKGGGIAINAKQCWSMKPIANKNLSTFECCAVLAS